MTPAVPVTTVPASTPSLPARLFSDRTQLLGSENAFRIGPHIRVLEDEGHHVVKCNLGEPDFPIANHIAEEVKRRIDAGETHYCDPQGIPRLREAVARAVAATRGIEVTPDRVVVFPGAKPPIGLCQQTYCNPGDEVIYPSPGYPIYESFTAYVGARPVPLQLEEARGFAFDGGDLERLISPRTRLVILNFPSNPTGGVASKEQLEDIARVVLDRAPAGTRVYSDEIYEDILFDGHRHLSIASLPGMAERTIIVGGVSKSYAWTGGRVGWAVFPTAEEAAVLRNLNINYFSCVPAYNQHGAAIGLESPLTRDAIAKMVAAFQERRDFMVKGLNAIDGIRCRTPGGAFYLFPNVSGVCERLGAIEAHAALPAEARERTSPATLFQMFLLWRHHVATLDRRSFGTIGSEGQHYLRISIATAIDDLRLGLERIRAAAADRRGFEDFVREGRHLW
jgi:aspartate/methionine/tyrosine aminotransferase